MNFSLFYLPHEHSSDYFDQTLGLNQLFTNFSNDLSSCFLTIFHARLVNDLNILELFQNTLDLFIKLKSLSLLENLIYFISKYLKLIGPSYVLLFLQYEFRELLILCMFKKHFCILNLVLSKLIKL